MPRKTFILEYRVFAIHIWVDPATGRSDDFRWNLLANFEQLLSGYFPHHGGVPPHRT